MHKIEILFFIYKKNGWIFCLFFVFVFVFVFCFFVRGYGPPDLATQPTKGKKIVRGGAKEVLRYGGGWWNCLKEISVCR